MKHALSIYSAAVILALLFISCGEDEGNSGIDIVVPSCSSVSSFTSTVNGGFNDDIATSDLLSGMCGVLYSSEKDASEAFNSWASGNDNPNCQIYSRAKVNSDGTMTSQLEKLEPETTYFYCFFYKSKSGKKRLISQEGSFSTNSFKPDIITGEAVDINYFSVRLNGGINVAPEDLKQCKVGVILSNDKDNLASGFVFEANEISSDGSFPASFSKLAHNTDYYYRTYIYVDHIDYNAFGEVKSVKTRNVDDMAVDMGLSVKWSNSDFMAQSPEDDGESYAWGMTKSLKKGSIDQYTYYSDGVYMDIGQSICGNADYDVVAQVYGGKWRMPSISEVEELFNNCSVEILQGTTDTNYLLFKSKNGSSIKISVMAYWFSTMGSSSNGKAAKRWTGTLFESSQDLGYGYVFSTGGTTFSRVTAYRFEEYCIRPVCDY